MPVGHVFSFGRHDPIQAPVDLSRIRWRQARMISICCRRHHGLLRSAVWKERMWFSTADDILPERVEHGLWMSCGKGRPVGKCRLALSFIDVWCMSGNPVRERCSIIRTCIIVVGLPILTSLKMKPSDGQKEKGYFQFSCWAVFKTDGAKRYGEVSGKKRQYIGLHRRCCITGTIWSHLSDNIYLYVQPPLRI